MKNMLLRVLGVVLFNTQIAYAWPGNSSFYELSTLEIKSQGAGYISVSMDKQVFPNQTKLFSLSHVEPGNHWIEIFTERTVYHGYYATNERIRIYAGNVYIQPASVVKGAVDHNGRFYIKDVDPLVIYHEPQPQYPQYPYEPYDPYQPHYPPVNNYALPLSDGEFDRLKEVVDDQWYDDTKLSVAKQALQTNWFTSAQVAEMMDVFWYEDTKLAYAKAAYAKVVDKQKYYIVNSEFWYSNSVEELNAYLSGH